MVLVASTMFACSSSRDYNPAAGTAGTGQGTGGTGSESCGTCETLGAECGNVVDDCGVEIHCGDCSGNQVCGGNGPNKCGAEPCVPATCSSLEVSCGMVNDGCGDTLSCGECSADEQCNADNQCEPRQDGGAGAGGSSGSAGAGGSSGSAGAGGSSGSAGAGGSSGGAGAGGSSGSAGGPQAPCTAATVQDCSVQATDSGQSVPGLCVNGTTGSCSYTCENGAWAEVSNTCTLPASCPANSIQDCTLGQTGSGNTVAGVCSSGMLGACTYFCNQGSWQEVTNSCRLPADCDGYPSGTVQTRTMYESALVPYNQQCQNETQTRTCTDGQWSSWSGSYVYGNCVVETLSCVDDGVSPELAGLSSGPYQNCHVGSYPQIMIQANTIAWSGCCGYLVRECRVEGLSTLNRLYCDADADTWCTPDATGVCQ